MSFLIYFTIVVATVSQSWAGKRYTRLGGSTYTFNAMKAAAALLMFAVMCVIDRQFTFGGILYGALYGILLFLSMYAGLRALALGPMSLTSMLASMSVIIPVFWGITVRNEEPGIFKYIAFLCILSALVSMNIDKLKAKEKNKGKGYAKWGIFISLTFVANGFCSVLQKEYQLSYPEGTSSEFMLWAMAVCALIYASICLIKGKKSEHGSVGKSYLGAFAGVMTGVSGFLTLALADTSNASVMFPLISAGTVIGALVCGKFIFREKLKLNHYAALSLGIIAVVLLKI